MKSKITNLEVSNLSRSSIYKIYRQNTFSQKKKNNDKKLQLVSRRLRMH